MKNVFITLLVLITIVSCTTTQKDFTTSNLNAISFYDMESNPITVNELTRIWNDRIQKDEELDAKITKLEITSLNNRLVLLGYTNHNSIKTASKLIKFKDGLKLDNLTITCHCGIDAVISINKGRWSCSSKDDRGACHKIETMVQINP